MTAPLSLSVLSSKYRWRRRRKRLAQVEELGFELPHPLARIHHLFEQTLAFLLELFDEVVLAAVGDLEVEVLLFQFRQFVRVGSRCGV